MGFWASGLKSVFGILSMAVYWLITNKKYTVREGSVLENEKGKKKPCRELIF